MTRFSIKCISMSVLLSHVARDLSLLSPSPVRANEVCLGPIWLTTDRGGVQAVQDLVQLWLNRAAWEVMTEGSVRMMSDNLYLVWSSMICSCLSIIRFSLSLTSSIFLSMSVTLSDNWKQMYSYSIFSFLSVTDLVVLQLAAPDVSA